MEYRLPTINDYEVLRDYVIEHYSNGERNISSSINLTNMNYSEWVDKINHNSIESDDEWGRYYLYLVFDNDKLVGLLNIRFELNDSLRAKYGDIGYGVRPSERRKGYATRMLAYAINKCKEKEMDYIILGCYKDNIGSNKTIIKNGGKLYRKDIEEKNLSDYWDIELNRNYYKIEL